MGSAGCSGEHELTGEGKVLEFALPVDRTDELANVPGVRFLEDALPGDAECRAQGIESRLGGDGLPPAVHDGHAVVSDGGDVVAMEVDHGVAGFGVKDHRGVSVAPVAIALDCLDHLCFDLTHGVFGGLVEQVQYSASGRQCTFCVTVSGASLPEECKAGIDHKVDHVISGRAVKPFAEPVHCQVSRCHGIKQEILQVLQVLVGEEVLFFHAPTIAHQG